MNKTVECKKKTSPDCLGTITFDTDEVRFKNTCEKCAEFNLQVALKRQHTARKLPPGAAKGNTNASALRSLVVFSHTEVAEQLGISDSRVWQLERDALNKCAAALTSSVPFKSEFEIELDEYRQYAADLDESGEKDLADEVRKEIRVLEGALSELHGIDIFKSLPTGNGKAGVECESPGRTARHHGT